MAESKFDLYVETLRRKWSEIPVSIEQRLTTPEMLKLSDTDLLNLWQASKKRDTESKGFRVRGWYHALYQDAFRNKKVMEIGSGFGVDCITFAQHGAQVTVVDIAESNLVIVRRICDILEIKGVKFHYLESLASLSELDNDYDVIWCIGSLINAPFDVTYEEVQALIKHLKPGGRWIELGYPKSRWEREGELPFEQWGEKTDGGAPWVEWKDLLKIKALLEPVKFKTVLYFEFHNSDFNWFDLVQEQDLDDEFNTDAEIDYQIVALERTQTSLKQTQTELKQTQTELKQALDQLDKVKNQLDLNQEELARSQTEIVAMQSTKFWKLRTLWIKLKQTLGMT